MADQGNAFDWCSFFALFWNVREQQSREVCYQSLPLSRLDPNLPSLKCCFLFLVFPVTQIAAPSH
jgi:hypothetical protein